MKKLTIALLPLCFALGANAQFGDMGGMGGMGNMNMGHFYGKVVDSVTGKGIPFAAVQLSGPKWDSASRSFKTMVIAGQLANEKGEFSLENLPIIGKFPLQISTMGYEEYDKTVSFSLGKLMNQKKKIPNKNDNENSGGEIEKVVDAMDKDLGNIKLKPKGTQLKTVTINGEDPVMELKMDKRVFNVSKMLTASGGTAEDVLKNIPGINVDINGSVTLRNSSPTIYVDGMPTMLTIQQIPADEIDKIEVITNPGAKYDASAGSGGIINIVMKHNKKLGFNGIALGGADSYGKFMGMLNLNVRKGKFNLFASVFAKQMEYKSFGNSTRDTIPGMLPSTPLSPWLRVNTLDTVTMTGNIGFGVAGFDYFLDNRNTFSLAGVYGQMDFNVNSVSRSRTDTLPAAMTNYSSQYGQTNMTQNMEFRALSFSYKHLFPKAEEDLTTNFTVYRQQLSGNSSDILNNNNFDNTPLSTINEQQPTLSANNAYIFKSDFTDPITKKIKLEAGVMATVIDVNNSNSLYLNSVLFNAESTLNSSNQQIYAAYATYSQDIGGRLSVQAGLRTEQSYFSGTFSDTTHSTFLPMQSLLYPFPSAAASFHLSEKSDFQLSYTSHITRPSFEQLVVNNYSSPQDIQLANPALKPAYMSSFELNYMYTADSKNNILASLYYKTTVNIISSQLLSSVYNPDLQLMQYTTTYNNANRGYSEGLELTSQNSIGKRIDVTANVNIYESGINATNLGIPDTAKPFLSYFAKLNLTLKLPYNFNIQIDGSYLSKTQIAPDQSGGQQGKGGSFSMGFGGGTASAGQYILPNYWVDAAIKKDLTKTRTASLTLRVTDIFGTAYNKTALSAFNPAGVPLYYSTSSQHREPRFIELTFTWMFGKMDLSLFKRKGSDPSQNPMNMGGGIGQ